MISENEVLGRYSELFRDFATEGLTKRNPKTLLELARVNESELAYSNIWQFFLSPAEDHDLGDVVLRSLLEASGVDVKPVEIGSAEIEREVLTDSGGFIDILISTDSLLCAVENKIRASVYNDLVDYSNYVDKRSNGRKTVKILLSMSVDDDCVPFTALRYDTFLSQLRINLGRRKEAERRNNRYLEYLNDIMTTLNRLVKSNVTESAFREFLGRHEKDAVALFARIESFKGDLHDKVRKLDKLIKAKVLRKGVQPSGADEGAFYESLWFEFKDRRNRVVTLEMWISASGWKSETYFAKDTVRKKQGKAFSYDESLEKIATYCEQVIQSQRSL